LYGYNQELIALSNIELSKIRDPKKHLNKSVEVCNNALISGELIYFPGFNREHQRELYTSRKRMHL